MPKFDPNNVKVPVWKPSPDAVFAASAAIEALARWEYCDCGCPNQEIPADRESVDFLRIAAFLRVELLPENTSAQTPENE